MLPRQLHIKCCGNDSGSRFRTMYIQTYLQKSSSQCFRLRSPCNPLRAHRPPWARCNRYVPEPSDVLFCWIRRQILNSKETAGEGPDFWVQCPCWKLVFLPEAGRAVAASTTYHLLQQRKMSVVPQQSDLQRAAVSITQRVQIANY